MDELKHITLNVEDLVENERQILKYEELRTRGEFKINESKKIFKNTPTKIN